MTGYHRRAVGDARNGLWPAVLEPEEGFEPSTFRLRVGCSASTWMAPDGSSLLTWAASSVQTAPDGYRRIVWMIKWMIKAHPTKNRMPRRLTPPQPRTSRHDPCQSSQCRYTTGLRKPPPSNPAHWPGGTGSAMLPRWPACASRPRPRWRRRRKIRLPYVGRRIGRLQHRVRSAPPRHRGEGQHAQPSLVH